MHTDVAQSREAARQAMIADGAHAAAIATFLHGFDQLAAGATGLIAEDTIEPLADLPWLADVEADPASDRDALATTAMIKLNGGLGTSMGLHRAKSLLVVRDGLSFLDIMARQVLATRERLGVELPLIFMHSFATQADCLAALAAYPTLPVDGLDLDFLQSREPKLRADDLAPVRWPANPALQWCPPGHGDLLPSLLATGLLDRLIERGYRYAFVSNGDNLGASPDERLAGWFARSGAPYAAEVTPRTPMDRKGGHLARRLSDGRIVLRDTAMTPAEDLEHFMDPERHPFAHCNSLWFDLAALRERLLAHDGALGLPLIRNAKTVDPTDPASTPVIQIETAMGTAVEVFDGAQAIVVGRDRFRPVKTTNQLLVLRSDAYALTDDARLRLRREPEPVVTLSEPYRPIDGLDARLPAGPPSLLEATSLDVRGDYTFGARVRVTGDVVLPPTDRPASVPDDAVLGPA